MVDALTDITQLSDLYMQVHEGENILSYPLEMICEVDRGIYEKSKDISLSASDFSDLLKVCKMPAKRLALWCQAWRDDYPLFIMLQSDFRNVPEKSEYVDAFRCSTLGVEFIGNVSLDLEGSLYGLNEELKSQSEKDEKLKELQSIFWILSIINQPQFTRLSPAGTRQQRRHAERKHNIPQERWRRIEWDLVKPKVQAGERVGSGRHMPLHFTRGHWRKALEHYDDAVQRSDGNWYKWINGYWSGHPAYGIVKSIHAPKVSDATKIMELAHG